LQAGYGRDNAGRDAVLSLLSTPEGILVMATKNSLTALQVMQDAPVIPVIVLNDVAHAVPLARALLAGGIRMLEVTLRTPQALACMEAIARDVPEAVLGAGTVRSAADARAAAAAGARFAVSPGYTQQIGQACQDFGLPLLPGVATGSEILMCQEDGLTALKFFPALQGGGLAMLKAWSGPFGEVRFCPTGGVTPANAPEFLALPNVVCVGGSWLVAADAMAVGDWARITRLAKESRLLGSIAARP
jgi:2-dehydro-3-deoxyphosphogluconate aldolase/(4S)-4-hydroxy-2-oxoglutarate aldolase